MTETGARIGYTQSDEITLVLLDGCGYFGMRFQKIVSMTAAFASSWFARNLDARIPERAGRSPLFDSRAWAVGSHDEAASVLLWRELDARKNAYTMAAAAKFSHQRLLNRGREGAHAPRGRRACSSRSTGSSSSDTRRSSVAART